MLTPFVKESAVTIPRKFKGTQVTSGCGISPSSGIFSESGSPSIWTKGDQQIGWKNDSWRTLVEKRLDASTSYYRRSITHVPSTVTVTSSWRNLCATYDSVWSGVYAGEPIFSAGIDADLEQIALKRLKSKLSSVSGKMNTMAPIAELKDLGKLTRFLVGSASNAVKALIDIKRSKGRSAFKFASEAWLNWSFAISPTLSEISDVMDAIDSFMLDFDSEVERYTGSAKKEWHQATTSELATSKGGNSTVVASTIHSLSYRFVAGISCRMRAANDYGAFSSHFGLSVPQLVPTLWELTAFSWLADYFGTIGDVLGDTFEVDQFSVIYGAKTRKYETNTTWFIGPSKSIYPGISSVSGTPTTQRYFVIERLPFTAVPPLVLRFKSSDEVARNGITKLLNLAAILVK